MPAGLPAALVAALAATALLSPAPLPGQEEESPEILGAPSALEGALLEEARVSVPAGTPLRERPDPRAPVLSVIQADSELPELERRGDWIRVRHLGARGWVADPALDPATVGSSGVPYAPSAPAPELLARARGLLEGSGAERRLGPWTLYTDVEEAALLDSLDRLAASLPGIYRERYGVDPGVSPGEGKDGEQPEVVVLFARDEAQRAFLGEGSLLAALGAEGHAGAGLVVLSRGDRSADAVRSLLVHELVHLLDRRALGPRTPPWLEEGLAHSLASSRITPSGRLEPEELGGGIRVVDRRIVGPDDEVRITVETTGGLAGLDRVVGALDRGLLEPLELLASRTWPEMVDPSGRELRYAQSGLLVRFLLDGREDLARGFRAYLAAVAGGGSGASERLPTELGTDWDALDRAFRGWLRARAQLLEAERRAG